MAKNKKILYNTLVIAVIFVSLAYLAYKTSFEGFQSIKSSNLFTDAYVITLDKYPERLELFGQKASAAGIQLIPWQGVIIDENDVESLPSRGIGSLLFQDRKNTYFNFGAIGCFLAHRNLLEHISENPVGLGTLIFEDDTNIPPDFYDRLSAVEKEIPEDWDYIFLRKYKAYGKPVSQHIQKLEKDVTSSKNMGLVAFIVKNSSIKEKILPCLEQMTDAIDFQLGRNADKINMYLIDPPIVTMDVTQNNSIIKDIDTNR
jgi:GR25 family glycosyltransferase involved in LPS biosynthesis